MNATGEAAVIACNLATGRERDRRAATPGQPALAPAFALARGSNDRVRRHDDGRRGERRIGA